MEVRVKNENLLGAGSRERRKAGLIYTFYSYKGGVGRSMAVANVAAFLAQSGKRVLILDWDLEAPGLEKFFEVPQLRLSGSRINTPGIVDLIIGSAESGSVHWRQCLISVTPDEGPWSSSGGSLDLICAGQLTSEGKAEYVDRLRELDWDDLFERRHIGTQLEMWRDEWIAEFDFVLVDSRTGISDVGSICTILLPDILVLVFTTSWQSVEGISEVIRRARLAQSALPVPRARLAAVPVLSRDEREKEVDLARDWRGRLAGKLGDLYQDWLPHGVKPEDVLLRLYIPQVAYWSFGERLPVVERSEDAADAGSIVAAYIRLGRFLETQLDWTSISATSALPAEISQRAKEEELRLEASRREVAEKERKLEAQKRQVQRDLDARQKQLEEAMRELESRQQESADRYSGDRFAKARVLVTGSILCAAGMAYPLLTLSSRFWHVPEELRGRWVAGIFAVLGSSLAQFSEQLREFNRGTQRYASPISIPVDVFRVLTTGLVAYWLPGANDASLNGALEWLLVGAGLNLSATMLGPISSIRATRSAISREKESHADN